jgi:hypothetical protein
MGIEWFRDLSITILGLVASVVLVFLSVLLYRLQCVAKSTMLSVQAASAVTYDTVIQVQEGIKPLLSILALIQGISGGIKGISKLFKNEQ